MTTHDNPATALRARLRSIGHRTALLRASAAACAALAGGCMGTLAFLAIDPLIDTPSWGRAAMVAALSGTAIAGLVIAARRTLRSPGAAEIAAHLHTHLEGRADRIVCAAELLDRAEGDTASAHLARRAAAKALDELLAITAARLAHPERRAASRWCIAACGGSALIALAWIAAPDATRTSLRRLANPSADIPPYAATTLSLSLIGPPPMAGEPARVSIMAAGKRPDDVIIEIRRDGGDAKPITVRAAAASDGSYRAEIQNILAPMRITARGGGARSAALLVSPDTSPRLVAATITITPPAYTRRPASTIAIAPHRQATADAVEGSAYRLDLVTSSPIDAATVTAPSARVEPAADRRALAWSGMVTGGTDVSIACESIGLDVRVHGLKDAPPTAKYSNHNGADQIEQLVRPEKIIAEAGDDLPLADVSFVWSLIDAEGRWQASGCWPAAHDQDAAKITAEQLISASLLAADTGELLIIRLEATESRPMELGGPRTAATAWRRFRIATADDAAPEPSTADQPHQLASAPGAASSQGESVSASEPRPASPASGLGARAAAETSNDESSLTQPLMPEAARTAAEPGTGSAPSDAASAAASLDGQVVSRPVERKAPSRADPAVPRATTGLVWRFHRGAAQESPHASGLDAHLASIPPADHDLARRYFELITGPQEPRP